MQNFVVPLGLRAGRAYKQRRGESISPLLRCVSLTVTAILLGRERKKNKEEESHLLYKLFFLIGRREREERKKKGEYILNLPLIPQHFFALGSAILLDESMREEK